ncbi:MAG: hypothetical protein AAGN35_16225 [Bacteroidota bacterium]
MQTRIFILSLLLLTLGGTLSAVTVKLKVTYKGAGVANCDVTIKHGDAALGSGRTDSEGKVSISASLLSPRIDVYGKKVCGGVTKTWDVKGWVTLDDDNSAHLKMEEVVESMSGSGMPESMLVSAWGLSASGCNDGGKSASNKSAGSGSSGTRTSGGGEGLGSDIADLRTENLKLKRDNLAGEIGRRNDRIARQKVDLQALRDGDATEGKIRLAQVNLQQEQLKLEKAELDYEEVDGKLDGPKVGKDRRKAIDARQSAIKIELDDLKGEEKKLKAAEKEIRKEERFDEMNKTELKKYIGEMKVKRNSKRLKLKMKGKNMEEADRTKLEGELEKLDADILRYQERLEELKAEE